MPRQYIAECSICRFNYRHTDPHVVQEEADRHEARTGHKGPFVWSLSEELQAFLANQQTRRYGYYE
jgi:hypothetical protein